MTVLDKKGWHDVQAAFQDDPRLADDEFLDSPEAHDLHMATVRHISFAHGWAVSRGISTDRGAVVSGLDRSRPVDDALADVSPDWLAARDFVEGVRPFAARYFPGTYYGDLATIPGIGLYGIPPTWEAFDAVCVMLDGRLRQSGYEDPLMADVA